MIVAVLNPESLQPAGYSFLAQIPCFYKCNPYTIRGRYDKNLKNTQQRSFGKDKKQALFVNSLTTQAVSYEKQ